MIIFLKLIERHEVMKTRAVTIYWDADKDLTTYQWSPEFEQYDWVTKLDILKDAIYDLGEVYDKELKNGR